MGILAAAKPMLHERERAKARGQMGCEIILGTRQKTHNTPKKLENGMDSHTGRERHRDREREKNYKSNV